MLLYYWKLTSILITTAVSEKYTMPNILPIASTVACQAHYRRCNRAELIFITFHIERSREGDFQDIFLPKRSTETTYQACVLVDHKTEVVDGIAGGSKGTIDIWHIRPPVRLFTL